MDNGTILAAVISAAVASIGVALAKDTKVSEFRQAWIDALRADMAEYITCLATLFEIQHTSHVRSHITQPESTKLANDMNKIQYRITMRLDAKKKVRKKRKVVLHRNLSAAMSWAQRAAYSPTTSRTRMTKIITKLESRSIEVLDAAWETVKSGEPRYRWVQRLSYSALCLSLLILAIQSWWTWEHRNDVQTTAIQIAHPVKVDVLPPLAPVLQTPSAVSLQKKSVQTQPENKRSHVRRQ